MALEDRKAHFFFHKESFSALFFAVLDADVDAVRTELDKDTCDINKGFIASCDLVAYSPLMLAAERCGNLKYKERYLRIINLLLDHPNCDINRICGENIICNDYSVLHYAVDSGCVEAVDLLLNSGKESKTRLFKNKRNIITDWDIKLCKVNLENHEELIPFQMACENGEAKIIERLMLDERCDVTRQWKYGTCGTCLHAILENAARERNDELIQTITLFLQHPKCDSEFLAKTDSLGHSALMLFFRKYGDTSKFQASNYYFRCVKTLALTKSMVEAQHYTLPFAVEFSTTEVCAFLLQNGASVNSSFRNKESALFCAIRMGSYDKCKLILSHNVDLTVQWQGMTVLQYGISTNSSVQIIRLLAKYYGCNQIVNDIRSFSYAQDTASECAHAVLLSKPLLHKSLTLSHLIKATKTQKRHLQDPKNYQKDNCRKKSLAGSSKQELDCRRVVDIFETLIVKIAKSHECNTSHEKVEIIEEATQFLRWLSIRLGQNPDTAHFCFCPILAGSMAEGTKTFKPDEMDFICEFTEDLNSVNMKLSPSHYPWCKMLDTSVHNDNPFLSGKKLAQQFYDALLVELNQCCSETGGLFNFGRLWFHMNCLERKHKISCVNLLWKGALYTEMPISIDLVPAFAKSSAMNSKDTLSPCLDKCFMIAKSNRLVYGYGQDDTGMESSHSLEESTLVKQIPAEIKRGYVIAKALRDETIIGQLDVNALLLTHDIKVEDVLTSYMLKNSLLHLYYKEYEAEAPPKENQSSDHVNAYMWADRIYEHTEYEVKSGYFSAFIPSDNDGYIFEYDRPTEVKMNRPNYLKSCVMLAICKQARKWLRENRNALEKHTN